MTAFQIANLIEAIFWATMGAGFLAHALARRMWRPMSLVAAVVLVAFGVSDLLEMISGAWWRPWWLALWKAVCVVALVLLVVRHSSRKPSDGHRWAW